MDELETRKAPPAPKGDVLPAQAKAEEKKKEPTADEMVGAHFSVPKDHDGHPDAEKNPHKSVRQFAEAKQLQPWQLAAYLARFKLHGLHLDAKLPHESHEKALHEALHGRI